MTTDPTRRIAPLTTSHRYGCNADCGCFALVAIERWDHGMWRPVGDFCRIHATDERGRWGFDHTRETPL